MRQIGSDGYFRNCPKRVGGACGVAFRTTETVLFGPFWPPFTSQIHGQSVVRTTLRTVSEGRILGS